VRRAGRLFQIIQILRRSTRPVTGAALAAELEVSKRTLYRDIATLMAQRVPISGAAGFGYVLDDEYDMPPLMLTATELEAMVLGAQWVALRDETELAAAARDVLVKIATAIPAHLRPFVAEPATGVEPPLQASPDRFDAGVIREAIRLRRKLRLVYRSEDDSKTERTVSPVVLGYSEAHRILVAWCDLRHDFRHFRTDRMDAVDVLDEPIPDSRGALLRRFEAWRSRELARREEQASRKPPA
jgi:predicted DNA-binding transcriptional regulator YafY